MQQVLERFPLADIKVGIVWIDMLPSDNEERARASAQLVNDSRASHFHDPERRTGRAVAESIGGEGKVAWDMYLFYTGESEWELEPPTPVDWLHQLGDAGWADLTRFRWGKDLVEGLHGKMEDLASEQRRA